MKFATLSIIAAALVGTVNAGCQNIGGNYYCAQTNKWIYNNVGFSGSYNDVTSMDENSGTCSSTPSPFSGTLSPLDQELSVHFRGPIQLKQFGVYYRTPGAGNKKRDDESDSCSSVEHHIHKHVKRATTVVTEKVVLDQYGKTVTPSSSAIAPAASSAAAAPPAPAPAPAAASSAAPQPVGSSGAASAQSSQAPSSASSAPSSGASSSGSASAGDWVRSSYFVPGSTTNCTIMNHFGGAGSGVWSSAFGNSISYANADNSGCSSSPVALGDVLIGSNKEFLIMSGLKCGDKSENSGCGFYRSGIPAYHGWSGVEKIFVFEFQMPSSGATGFNGDMPAIWMLNAKIPRTLQYGAKSCSCWDSGCGELDLFEILSTGSNMMITHLHDKQGDNGSGYGGGGSGDYVQRPLQGSMKAAAIFTKGAIHVMQLDSSVSFDAVLGSSIVDAWVAAPGSVINIA